MSEPGAGHPIRILTVDDHPVLRDGIAAIVETQADMEIVGEAADGMEAIDAFRRLKPDVTLMDLQMPKLDGVGAINVIRQEFPNARMIVLTTYSGDAQALRALKAGAAGYLLKSSLRRELLETIRAVHSGLRRVPPEIANQIALHAGDQPLTERELGVLRLAGEGKANKDIAWALTISEETVKGHMKSIFSKLGVRDRTHAVTIAAKRGIIEI